MIVLIVVAQIVALGPVIEPSVSPVLILDIQRESKPQSC